MILNQFSYLWIVIDSCSAKKSLWQGRGKCFLLWSILGLHEEDLLVQQQNKKLQFSFMTMMMTGAINSIAYFSGIIAYLNGNYSISVESLFDSLATFVFVDCTEVARPMIFFATSGALENVCNHISSCQTDKFVTFFPQKFCTLRHLIMGCAKVITINLSAHFI